MHLLPVLISLTLCEVPESVFDLNGAWEHEETDGDIKVEGRPVAGSSWLEYRAVTTTDLPVQTLCDVVFEEITKGKGPSNVKLRKLVEDGPTTRVLYDQVDGPMISMRDYAMTIRKIPGDGTCRIRFKITNEKAPAKPDGVVRMENMWGGWELVPVDGKLRVTHFLYADPAGSVPAFIARGSQKKALKQTLQGMLAMGRAAKDAGR